MQCDSFDADVAIVGYGPVGQTLTALLAARGHSVAVYERYPDLYDLPRAVYFDDEIKQVWQALGVVDEIADDLLPVDAYEWFGADGEPILRLAHPEVGPSGWASGYLFYQPSLERALDRARPRLPSARVHQGWNVEALEQAGDHVALTVRHEREERVRARYVVGADGANSLVRQAAGIAFDDQGFAERWLVVDVRPDDMEALSWLPSPCQWCDPARPHMHSRNGRQHRRFEFMLLPGECAEDFADEARVWELLAPWFTPDRRRARAPRGLRVPRPAREHDARGPRAARRRRRAHHAAVHGPGALLGRARRREPRVAPRPRPARALPTTGCSTATRPSAGRTTSGSSTSRRRWGASRARSTRTPPPSATPPCAPPTRRRRRRSRHWRTACSRPIGRWPASAPCRASSASAAERAASTTSSARGSCCSHGTRPSCPSRSRTRWTSSARRSWPSTSSRTSTAA